MPALPAVAFQQAVDEMLCMRMLPDLGGQQRHLKDGGSLPGGENGGTGDGMSNRCGAERQGSGAGEKSATIQCPAGWRKRWCRRETARRVRVGWRSHGIVQGIKPGDRVVVNTR